MKSHSLGRVKNMPAEKKNIILAAAIDVFAREGFYNTNTSTIAEEAGVAVGTIYNYFDNKEAILEEIFAREFEHRIKKLQELSENEELNALEKLEEFFRFHFDRVKENPNLGQVLVREREFPRKKSEAIKDYFYSIPGKLENLLLESEEGEKFEVNDPELFAAVIFGSVQGIMEQALRNDDLSTLDEAPELLISLLRNGISD